MVYRADYCSTRYPRSKEFERPQVRVIHMDTFDPDIPGTFERATGGTFNPLLLARYSM